MQAINRPALVSALRFTLPMPERTSGHFWKRMLAGDIFAHSERSRRYEPILSAEACAADHGGPQSQAKRSLVRRRRRCWPPYPSSPGYALTLAQFALTERVSNLTETLQNSCS